MWTPAYKRRRISGCCFSNGQRKRRKYICVCTSLREYWWLMIVCYHRLTAKRKKKKIRKARIVFVRGATLIANTLRKHKPLCLCTYIYVSLTFIVFCKTISRNLHNGHFMSQERRTRHSARISVQPCKVFRGNPRMDSTFRIPGTRLGELGFRCLNWSWKKLCHHYVD